MDPFSEYILKCLNKYKGLQKKPIILKCSYQNIFKGVYYNLCASLLMSQYQTSGLKSIIILE